LKICPNCGSKNIDLLTPIESTIWLCNTCEYIGPAIDGNDELIKELTDNYIEKLKEEKFKNNTKLNPEYLKKINEIQSKKIKEICPNCGSENIDYMVPGQNSLWFCKTCGFLGPILEGNEEFSQEMRKKFIEKKKKEGITVATLKIEEDEDVLNDELFEKRVRKLIENDFDSNLPQNEILFSEDDLIKGIDNNIIEIYKNLKNEILNWNDQIELKPSKDNISFSYHDNFLKVSFENDKINLELSFNENNSFDDYKDITKEINKNDNDQIIILHFSLNSCDDIEYALFLIKQSYENNKDGNIERFLNKILPQNKYY